MNKEINSLIKNLMKLPSVGEKTAQRLAFFLINSKAEISCDLGESLINIHKKIKRCNKCNILTTNNLCEICSDTSRDENIICVVESTEDVYLIEKTRNYDGVYLVIKNLLSPIDGLGPDSLPIDKLEKLLENENIREVILALNPSAEGESTIHYLNNILEKYKVDVTRLATGIPFGGDIGYSSPMTLSNAFSRRFKIDK